MAPSAPLPLLSTHAMSVRGRFAFGPVTERGHAMEKVVCCYLVCCSTGMNAILPCRLEENCFGVSGNSQAIAGQDANSGGGLWLER